MGKYACAAMRADAVVGAEPGSFAVDVGVRPERDVEELCTEVMAGGVRALLLEVATKLGGGNGPGRRPSCRGTGSAAKGMELKPLTDGGGRESREK